MRRIAAATLTVALCVVGSPMASAGPASSSPTLTCGVTTIPARSGGVRTTCGVENFPPNATVRFHLVEVSAVSAVTDASGRASATVIIPCCFPDPGEITITATAEDGTTASTTIKVVAAAAESLRGQPTLTG